MKTGIAPGCPGCGATARASVVAHQCPELSTKFLTARGICPFCDEKLGSETATSSSIANSIPQAAEAGLKKDGPGKHQKKGPKSASDFEPGSANADLRKGSDPLPAIANPTGSPGPAASVYVSPSQSHLHREPSKLRFSWLFSAGVIVIVLGTVLVIGINSSRSRSSNANAEAPKKDPRAIPEEMVYVPGGEFMMGSNNGDEYEQPPHKVSVNPFLIDIYEVSCGQYEKFVKSTGHRVPPYWSKGICPPAAQRKPVVEVDWHDAKTYAKWAGKRLPTEEEWEFAARGSDGRKYPWGNEWQANVANAGDSSAGDFVDVGSYPLGKSPFGVMDMIGNAWEWTASDLKPYPGGRLSKPPQEERKLMRGASWFKDKVPDWTATFRGFAAPTGGKDYTKVGFRCAKDLTVSGNEK